MGIESIIGIDAHGGDTVSGMSVAMRIAIATITIACRCPKKTFVLVGDKSELQKEIGDNCPANVVVEHCIDEKYGAIKRLAEKTALHEIGGFYTIANTQLVVPVVRHRVGILEEFTTVFNERLPLLLAELPKSPTVTLTNSWYLLDAGSIPHLTRPEQYVAYAHVGSIYARAVDKRERPAVGLLNIGSEPGKGGAIEKEAYEALEKSELRFIGNVEPFCCINDRDKGSDIERPVDVVITDGFTGNTFIKTLAAGAEIAGAFLKREIVNGSLLEKLAGKYLSGREHAFDRLKNRIDPGQYGGAAFIGLNAPVFKGHGTTSIYGLMVGLDKYMAYVDSGAPEQIRQAFAKVHA